MALACDLRVRCRGREARPARDRARRDPGRRRDPAARAAGRCGADAATSCTPGRSVDASRGAPARARRPGGRARRRARRGGRRSPGRSPHGPAGRPRRRETGDPSGASRRPDPSGIAEERALFLQLFATARPARRDGRVPGEARPPLRRPTPERHRRRHPRSVASRGNASAGSIDVPGVLHLGLRNEPACRTWFEEGTRGRPPCPRGRSLGKDVTRMADERFRGASVRTLPRPNRTYSTGPRVRRSRAARPKLSDVQQVAVLLAARTGPRLRPARQAQEQEGAPDPAPQGRARRDAPGRSAALLPRVRDADRRSARPEVAGRFGGSRPGPRRADAMGGTAPPSGHHTMTNDARRTTGDAHGRLPVLRARGARVRGAAAVPDLRLPARGRLDAAVHVPDGEARPATSPAD